MEEKAVQKNAEITPDRPPLKVCPNCGHAVSGNYCSNCGQQTHLHKDTFWGLISHFVAHYFHYDSKFWRTLSTLVTSPGKLTIAYRQKKRQSYIPPISLYIFVSIVFFLLLPMFQRSFVSIQEHKPAQQAQVDTTGQVSVKQRAEDAAAKQGRQLNSAEKYTTDMGNEILSGMKENPKEYKEKVLHSFPKIFFFMIPVLAALLKLLLIRQKQYYFVDHAVFALHIHSFVFIACIIPLVNPYTPIQHNLSDVAFLVCIVYFIIALHKAYKGGWIKSIIIALATTALYFIILLLTGLFDLWILTKLAH